MSDGKPERIAIEHDDYHAEHIGRTSDGRQFFLTTPFEPAIGDRPGSEYVALFVFDADGTLIDAKIDDFGPRATLDDAKRRACFDSRLQELGEVTFERFEVKPFAVERFGTSFGLVPREPEDEDDDWAVEMPGAMPTELATWACFANRTVQSRRLIKLLDAVHFLVPVASGHAT